MLSNHNYSLAIALFLITPWTHTGKLQDLLDWATGNTPDRMCRQLGIMYQEIYNKPTLTPQQANALEQVIFVCSARNLARIVGAPKSTTNELDEAIKAAYPVIMHYVAKK